jgi:hypothetical protein
MAFQLLRPSHSTTCYIYAVSLPLGPVRLPLVLASQSPRRGELLATAGIPFTVRVREVEEIRAPGEAPDAYVRRLAYAKLYWARTPSSY